jgi:Mg-chelatase subunit ChlI
MAPKVHALLLPGALGTDTSIMARPLTTLLPAMTLAASVATGSRPATMDAHDP